MKISNPTARLGEEIAAKYLTTKGFKVIERNFRKGYGEIDIICTFGKKVLVFVEVKTRKSINFGDPLEAITYSKLKTLTKTAEFYKALHKNLPDQLRIDAVSVLLSIENKAEKIEHIENITGF
jgi:putative endonuclease